MACEPRRQRRADPQPEKRQTEKLRNEARMGGHEQAGFAEPSQKERSRHHAVGAVARRQPSGERAANEGQHGARQHEQRGVQRRIAQHELQPLAPDQSQTDHAERRDQRGHDGDPEPAVIEQAEIDQGRGAAALSPHEPDERCRADHGRRRGRGKEGSCMATSLTAKARSTSPTRISSEPEVPAHVASALAAGNEDEGGGESGGSDGNVDQEDRAPPEMFQQRAADQRRDRRAARGHRAPQADRQGALPVVGEGQLNDRQGRGHHHRRTDRKQGAGGDQQHRRGRVGCDQRGHAKRCEAKDEHALVTDAIAQRATAGQEARHHQRIGVHDPELLRSAGAQLAGQGRQSG